MAIEKVQIYNYIPIMQDELLAHRFGLIPLKADPWLFEHKTNEGDAANAQDTLEFELKVKCTKKNKNSTEVTNNDSMYQNHSIYFGQIKWVPVGNQASNYKEADVGPIDDDILDSRMRPGHEFDIKLFGVKRVSRITPSSRRWPPLRTGCC